MATRALELRPDRTSPSDLQRSIEYMLGHGTLRLLREVRTRPKLDPNVRIVPTEPLAPAPPIELEPFEESNKLYATRAVPFPTILEIEDVEQQLTNHKREIRGLLEPGVRTGAELAIAEIYAKEDLIKKEKDRAAKPYVHKLNIIRNDYLRNAILVLLP